MKEFEIRNLGSRHGRQGRGMYKFIGTMNTRDNEYKRILKIWEEMGLDITIDFKRTLYKYVEWFHLGLKRNRETL